MQKGEAEEEQRLTAVVAGELRRSGEAAVMLLQEPELVIAQRRPGTGHSIVDTRRRN